MTFKKGDKLKIEVEPSGLFGLFEVVEQPEYIPEYGSLKVKLMLSKIS